MMFSQCNTCSMGILYLTIQYQGECGHMEGHAYFVLFVHNEICVFWALGFHIYMISLQKEIGYFNHSFGHFSSK